MSTTAKSTKVEDDLCKDLVYLIGLTNTIDIFTVSLQKCLLVGCFILLIVKKISLVQRFSTWSMRVPLGVHEKDTGGTPN
jgi:hypothetical protein